MTSRSKDGTVAITSRTVSGYYGVGEAYVRLMIPVTDEIRKRGRSVTFITTSGICLVDGQPIQFHFFNVTAMGGLLKTDQWALRIEGTKGTPGVRGLTYKTRRAVDNHFNADMLSDYLCKYANHLSRYAKNSEPDDQAAE